MHKPQFDGTPTTEEYRAYLALLLRDTFIGRAENLPLARAYRPHPCTGCAGQA